LGNLKVVSLVGARPQIIEEAVVQEQLQKHEIEEVLVHSGQHYDYDMSDVFFKVLKIRKPDYNLGVGSGTHAEITGRTMIAFEQVVMKEKPDVILVYGDTDTTVAGALVGAKLKVPVAHVEAGIRQQPHNMPEEINRRVTDHVSDLLFAPSQLAVENLTREGVTNGVHFVGDVMYDLFLKMKPHFDYSVIDELSLQEGNYVVVTIHRDFNTDDPVRLKWILDSLRELSKQLRVVFSMHPGTKKRIQQFGFGHVLEGMDVIQPLDYLKLMGLVMHSAFVITDSGGLQKETYFCGKRTLVVMPDTGWRELVDTGWNVLVDKGFFDKGFSCSMTSKDLFGFYGKGDASCRVVQVLTQWHETKYAIDDVTLD